MNRQRNALHREGRIYRVGQHWRNPSEHGGRRNIGAGPIFLIVAVDRPGRRLRLWDGATAQDKASWHPVEFLDRAERAH